VVQFSSFFFVVFAEHVIVMEQNFQIETVFIKEIVSRFLRVCVLLNINIIMNPYSAFPMAMEKTRIVSVHQIQSSSPLSIISPV